MIQNIANNIKYNFKYLQSNSIFIMTRAGGAGIVVLQFSRSL